MRKGLGFKEREALMEAEINDINLAMQGNPLSKRWQLLQNELSIKMSTLAAMREKKINNAPSIATRGKNLGLYSPSNK
jgi:hypothetical protein